MVQLFEKFAEMIEKLPPKGVLRAVSLERQMLESDLAQKRTLPLADVRSIVAFCGFVESGPEALRGSKISIPVQHLGFYRNTVRRLVESGELPNRAFELFEDSFSALLQAA